MKKLLFTALIAVLCVSAFGQSLDIVKRDLTATRQITIRDTTLLDFVKKHGGGGGGGNGLPYTKQLDSALNWNSNYGLSILSGTAIIGFLNGAGNYNAIEATSGNLGIISFDPSDLQMNFEVTPKRFHFNVQNGFGGDSVSILRDASFRIYTNGTNRALLNPKIADGASAVAYIEDTHNSLTTPGAKLKSFRNQGTEKTFIDKDGNVEVTTSSQGIILKSPDGTRYKITIANGGTLTVTAL